MKTWKMVIACTIIMALIGLLGACSNSGKRITNPCAPKPAVKVEATKRMRAKRLLVTKSGNMFKVEHVTVIDVDPLIKVGDTVLITQGSGLNVYSTYFVTIL